ncbi:MAG: exonuclease domain-containing protein [Coprococcus sp.]
MVRENAGKQQVFRRFMIVCMEGTMMEYVFVDFEMNQIDFSHSEELKICKNEIIEIGAVRLNDSYQEIDSFKTYVKPAITPVTGWITELTGITNDMVDEAPSYAEAMDLFISWCKDADIIYAWSENDLRQLNRERRLKSYENTDMAEVTGKWKDFQKEFARMLGIKRRIALSDAVFYLGEEFQGEEHDALWDARNTAAVFVLSKDEENFKRIMAPIADIYKPKKSMTYSIADVFKNIKLDE